MNKIIIALIAALIMTMNVVAAVKPCRGRSSHISYQCGSYHRYSGHCVKPSYYRGHCGPSYHRRYYHRSYYGGGYYYYSDPLYPGCYYYDHVYTEPVVRQEQTTIVVNNNPTMNVDQSDVTTIVEGGTELQYDRDGQPIKETEELYWVPSHYEDHVSFDGRKTQVYIPGQYVRK